MKVKFYINPSFANAFSWDGAMGSRYGVSILWPDINPLVVKAYHDIAGQRYGSDFCTAQLANHPAAVCIELDEPYQRSMASAMGCENQHIRYASEWTADMVKKGWTFLDRWVRFENNINKQAVIRYPVVHTREFRLDMPAQEARKEFESMTPQEWEDRFGRGELIPNAVSDERYIPLWGEEDYPTVEDEEGTTPIAETEQVLVGLTEWSWGQEDRWIATRLTAGKKWDAVGVIIPCSEKGRGVVGTSPMQGDIVEYGGTYGLVVACWRPQDGVIIPGGSTMAMKMEVRIDSIAGDMVCFPIDQYDTEYKPHEDTIAIIHVWADPAEVSKGHGNGIEPFNWVLGGDGNNYQVIKQIVRYV